MDTPQNNAGVGVFIDYEYLHISLERVYGFVLDADVVIEGIRGKVKDSGKIILEKAYAPWSNFINGLTELSKKRVETVNISSKRVEKTNVTDGRRCTIIQNNADIYIAWDIAQIIYSKTNINTFVLVSGDGDFVEVVKRVQQNGNKVIVMGFENNTSDLLRGQADEFVPLDDLAKINEELILTRIIDLSLDLELKLDYIGFKLLVDIMEREDPNTKYREYLQRAIDDGVFTTEHRPEPGSVKGEVFALIINRNHPVVKEVIAKRLAEGRRTNVEGHIPSSGGLDKKPSTEDHDDDNYIRAVHEIESGNYEEGYEAITAYLEKYPDDILAYLWVIQCLINLDKKEELQQICEKVYGMPGFNKFTEQYPDWARYIETKVNLKETNSKMDN
ncbi:MAG: NYN domain-containing protein [bacterium]|nr:NYN domain-containing protein [bacterium]